MLDGVEKFNCLRTIASTVIERLQWTSRSKRFRRMFGNRFCGGDAVTTLRDLFVILEFARLKFINTINVMDVVIIKSYII